MPAFLPKIFKSKAGRKKSDQNSESEQKQETKKKTKWGLRLPKRYRMEKLMSRFRKKTVEAEEENKPDENVRSLPPTPASRRRRPPNIATTQRKLAASKKRLRVSVPRKDTPVVPAAVPRRITEISEATHSSIPSQDLEGPSLSVPRRLSAPTPFIMTGEKGSMSIEVEFTDDCETPCDHEEVVQTKRLSSGFPMSFMSTNTDKDSEIGVEWKPQIASGSHCETRSTTPSRYFSLPTELDSGHSTGRRNLGGKSTYSSDCGSASGSSDVAMDVWVEYRKDRVIERLAGMKIQKPVESQGFEDKRTMKIQPPVSQTTYTMMAYAGEQDSKDPEWIQQWHANFRSPSPPRSVEDSYNKTISRERPYVSGIPKPGGKSVVHMA